ncbi:MAG: HAD hydrolase-like protein [Promethearchaeia archaeon]
MSNINTIIFDLGGVYFTQGSPLARAKLREKFKIEDRYILKKIFSNKEGSLGNLLRLGKISMREFEEGIIEELDLPISNPSEIRKAWFNSYVPYHGVINIIKQLKKEGYHLVVFSGNVTEKVQFLEERYNFKQHFDAHVFSNECCLNKRSLPFYKELTNHVKSEASEAILIDDQRRNLSFAEKVGFNTILYFTCHDLIQELEKYGVQVNGVKYNL